MDLLESLLLKHDVQLYSLLKNMNIEISHFAFRWIYCLLLREFPVFLSVQLMDNYFLDKDDSENTCVYLTLTLLIKFSGDLKKKSKDEVMLFLHKLPTENWGYRDINGLIEDKRRMFDKKFN